MTHFLSVEKSNGEELLRLLADAQKFKTTRGQSSSLLSGQTWALIFNKPSTRTRVSFEVGLRELGANVIFLSQNDLQLGRGEPIIDTARVLGRIVHGAIIRTFAQADIESFASYGAIPTINALTDEEHPCQIVADLFTILEERGTIDDLRLCFVGDGDCNVTRSWIWAAEHLGFELLVAAPRKYQPAEALKGRIKSPKISFTSDVKAAVAGANVLYTDVWVSMGKETESAGRLADLVEFQINDELVKLAAPRALVMHCLPAYRGKEITESVLEAHAATIFSQAENRLHAQKAIIAAVSPQPHFNN
ncbi:MAG TPA: ornithine carbamoyltransferase [Chthoniobacterales bacterium]|jgi:ornithine carbamoyltransferase|nr:ornithine carbamoyltransferase [Chthoniobacterales bacterium]